MKKLEAIIQPFKLDAVKEQLSRIGVQGVTVTEVRGCGRQERRTQRFRGAEYAVDFVPKVKLEIIVADEMAALVVEAICNAARTDDVGDGKILVLPTEDVVRIRTGERGVGAVSVGKSAPGQTSMPETYRRVPDKITLATLK